MGKTKGKSKAKAKVTKPRARRQRKTRNVSEYASLSEVVTLQYSGNNPVTNTLYSLMNTSLDQFDRATQVAKAYQHYRIKYIQLKIKPAADTYFTVQAGQTATSKPNVYYMIDKAGAVPTNITLEGLKKMGAKPRALDEKPVVIGWKPSVLENVMTAGGAAPTTQGSRYKISPWLNTNANSVDIAAWNPSTVDHLGVYWYVEQQIVQSGNQPYFLEYEVQFEFKKPLMATAVGEFNAIPVQHAVQNRSRDGIIGGSDDAELVAPVS